MGFAESEAGAGAHLIHGSTITSFAVTVENKGQLDETFVGISNPILFIYLAWIH